MLTSQRLRRTVTAVAIAATAAISVPTFATADPVATDPLAQAIDTLSAAENPNSDALAAANAIAKADLSVDKADSVDIFSLFSAANAALDALGIDPFLYPTIAPFCNVSDAIPLGLVPAVAGAVPGPYSLPGISFPPIGGFDPNLIRSGEVLFAFVPAGIILDGTDKTGMQVAWFNVNTFQGGFAAMGGLAETILAQLLEPIPAGLKEIVSGILTPIISLIPSAGVRLAPVETGKGLVLAAIFGSVTHSGGTCYFFPTIGITQVN
ncbi:MAG: hypothetical protein ACRCSF_09125 [Mycobacteriaceae bacterium]